MLRLFYQYNYVMSTLLIAIIYLAFISLGLPDSLLGSAWPEMHQQMNVPISMMGLITMIISFGTIVSSLFTNVVVKKLGTGLVVVLSTALTILGLIGFSFSNQIWMICLFSIPYGLGAGAIDASLNNYVAINYSSKYMSWLHCFWGVGTIISPYVMGYAISSSYGWSTGYLIIGIIQLIILIILVCSLSLWKKVNNKQNNDKSEGEIQVKNISPFKIKGVMFVLIGFLCYCASESTIMLWASSYLFETKSISEDLAANYASLVFIGLTVSRFVSGFIANKLGDKNMIRLGLFISVIGVVLLFIPVDNILLSLLGFVIIGFGFGPVYPSIIHATPSNFGENNSQSIIGIQMAFAYTGSTFLPPLFGLIADYININLLPAFILLFVILTFVMLEILNFVINKRHKIDN